MVRGLRVQGPRVQGPGFVLVALVLVTLATVEAQQAQQAPTFRTGVQYVSVDVVVTDSNDVPVAGLTKDDFEILDLGKNHPITDFRYVSVPVSSTSLVDLKTAPPASDVASNARPATDSRLFVLLVDTLHTLESEVVPIKQVMTEFVRSVAPDDEVAIVYVGRSDLGVNFTTDRTRLLKGVDHIRAASGFAVDALGRTGNGVRGRDMKPYARTLATSLTYVATALSGSSHPRRAIVYVGAGSPLDVFGDAPDLQIRDEFLAAYDTARRLNVPIYTIDPRGMVQPADAVRGGIGGDQVVVGLRNQRDLLSTSAANTGGRALLEQSDITGAMRQIVAENGSFYLLGYYPETPPAAGEFRSLDVRVKRPGLRVRHRAGYQANTSTTDDTSIGEQLSFAMGSALDVRGLTLRAAVAPLMPAGKMTRTAVTVQVTYPTAGVGDLPFDSLRIQLLALDGDGKAKARTEREYIVRPPRSERETVAVVINEAIDLPTDPLTLRIGVASRALGRAGTLQVPVSAPKLSDSRIQMGALVLGTPQSPGPPTLGDEFVRPLLPFQPTTRRIFAPSQTLRIFTPIFWRGRETAARAILTLEGVGVTLRREEKLLAVSTSNGTTVTSLDTLIPLAQLSGALTLTVESSVNDRERSVRSVRFEVRR